MIVILSKVTPQCAGNSPVAMHAEKAPVELSEKDCFL